SPRPPLRRRGQRGAGDRGSGGRALARLLVPRARGGPGVETVWRPGPGDLVRLPGRRSPPPRRAPRRGGGPPPLPPRSPRAPRPADRPPLRRLDPRIPALLRRERVHGGRWLPDARLPRARARRG